MKLSVVKGLSKEDEEIIRRQFEESKAIRRQLAKVIEEKIQSARAGALSKDGYDKPSWPYFQADVIGYERGLREMLSLLED